MYDVDLVINIFEQIKEAIQKILTRFSAIQSVDDFINTEEGMEKLDAICMQLIAIGESIKNVDKITQNSLLRQYPEIDWKGVMGMRDIISHHYFDIDAEIIYEVCKTHVPELNRVVDKILSDLAQLKEK